MANFDAAAGITQAGLSDLLSQYYQNVPSDNDPFKGEVQKPIPGMGTVTLDWNIGAAPTLVFGPPSQEVWNEALDSSGKTNGEDKVPLPSLPMVQVTLPTLTASYKLGTVPPVGGTAKDVVAYATLAFEADTITPALVAVTLDESGFSAWDKAIFNNGLLPQIFASVKDMLSVVHVPSISWQGVTLNPVQIQLVGDQLVAAATLTTNTDPLDVGGVAWPTDPVFVIVSNVLVNGTLGEFISPYQGAPFKDSGDYNGLADWNYDGSVSSLSASVKTVDPLTVEAQLTVSLNVSATLTAKGMALAGAGCALAAGL